MIPCCLYSSVAPPTISKTLASHELLATLSFEDVLAFTSRASALKRDIMLPQLQTISGNVPPDILPPSICEFLQLSTGLTRDTVAACWHAFKEIVWGMPSRNELAAQHERAFPMGGTPPQGVSAQACANIYDSALSMRDENQLQDAGWQFGFKLKNEHIWDTFIILALTEDCDRCGVLLDVPNDGAQTHRFPAAMQARNERIVYEGQPELRHYCDTCMWTYWNDDGSARKVQVVVTDGLSMGRPCCNVFQCRNPLSNNRSRFCWQHLNEGLDNICAVVDCDMPVLPGWKACTLPAHQEMECLHGEKMRTNFQATKRLQKMHAAQPNDAMVAQQ
ncbi:uncharacterized protein EDB91DRAFT_1254595 [Suillus paluster]|uniref:uncharacterized protein n=1 Tax=Suillus paluster TaxID=48578 RepID=UPI001B87B42D|nr:uncharacterized protein EDB91DRAFT_1254595 [Suillus paluster]KAG1725787.1 hypothetical protein EDB91DRAFT_1254595 [Suillus paluster]